MKILDTNALDYMVKQDITQSEEFFITPDIQDEYEAWHEAKLPKRVTNIFDSADFDRVGYLSSYKHMLNKYGQRSFYNMSGFGDISVLAVLMAENTKAANMLPGLAEEIVVVSNDGPLARKIKSEFCSKEASKYLTVSILSPEEFFK